jgi:trehalose/maltose hydrolase-like predicted phosphorylase
MAITSLRYAAQAARELKLVPNPDWEHVAQNIPILKFPDGVTKENATYDGVDIKQADVNLLAYPLDVIKDRGQIEKDLKYYEQRMSAQGPAMGHSVLSTLYSKLGNPEKAYEIFGRSYKPNEVPPFGVIAETAGGTNPYFATGAGGMLQAVIFGFGGLQVTDAGIIQNKTTLPKKWTQMELRHVGVEGKNFIVK